MLVLTCASLRVVVSPLKRALSLFRANPLTNMASSREDCSSLAARHSSSNRERAREGAFDQSGPFKTRGTAPIELFVLTHVRLCRLSLRLRSELFPLYFNRIRTQISPHENRPSLMLTSMFSFGGLRCGRQIRRTGIACNHEKRSNPGPATLPG